MDDIDIVVEDLKEIFPVFDAFPEGVRMAMIDMRYQLGPGGFRGVKKMIAAARSGALEEAAAQIRGSRYYGQATARAERAIAMMCEDAT